MLEELRNGGTNAKIAERLRLSPETVKTHIARMLSKLDLPDRHALAAWRPGQEGMARRWLFAPLVKPLAGLGLAAGAVVFAVAIAALLGRAHEEAYVALPPVEDITLSAGADTTCLVRESGAVVCWGENSDGQTDAPSGSFRSISVGGTGVFGAHVCGVHRSGAVVCWGANDHGQADAPSGSYRLVSAGGRHTCALLESGEIACWGENVRGRTDAPPGTYGSVSAGWDPHVRGWGDREGQVLGR